MIKFDINNEINNYFLRNEFNLAKRFEGLGKIEKY